MFVTAFYTALSLIGYLSVTLNKWAGLHGITLGRGGVRSAHTVHIQ